MSTTTLILLLLGIVVIFVLRTQRRLALLALQIRGLREQALEHLTYRPYQDSDFTAALAKATQEIEGQGFTLLGDHTEEAKLAGTSRPLRWFVDGAKTTFGWMAPFEVVGARHVVIVLMSHELDRQVISARQPASSMLSRPPFVTVQHVAPATSFAGLVKKHREKAGLDDPERAFIPVKTFEEVVHELDRMRDQAIAWRQAQPPAELLEADLKSLLGAQYAKLGDAMKKRLAR